MLTNEEQEFADLLLPMINENRLSLLRKVLKDRTRYISVVLEDIYQPQNASAVLRTCDCFGIQDVHIIENRNSYEINPEVELGAAQWLNLHRYSEREHNTEAAILGLKESGYRIIATSPHRDDVVLDNFDLEKGKVAVMFGTEQSGLSEKAMAMADEFVKIPMLGFTESFNISVSAALVMHSLRSKLQNSSIDWRIDDDSREAIWYRWLKNSVHQSAQIEQAFKKRMKQ